MRALLLLLPLALSACATPPGNAPSLAPRSSEAIDPRIPIADPIVAGPPSPALVAQLQSLVGQALAGDAAFRPAADRAARLAASAGQRESESWIAAQQALSVAIAVRAPVTRAIAEIDAIGARFVQSQGGIPAGELAAISAAAAEVAQIDTAEAATIDRIQSALRR